MQRAEQKVGAGFQSLSKGVGRCRERQDGFTNHGDVVVSKHLFAVLCVSDCEEVFMASEWRCLN